MSGTAEVGVFLCQGGRAGGDSLDFKRLRWTAEAALAGGRVFEVSRACQSEGSEEMARLARENGLGNLIIGACPLVCSAGPALGKSQTEGASGRIGRVIDLCAKPDGGDGRCQVVPGAQQALCQALAALKNQVDPQIETVAVEQRVLVLGHGLAALHTAHGLARAGYPVTVLTPTKRLAPPEPLLGPDAAKEASSLAGDLAGMDQVELVTQGVLLGLAGSAGDFSALLAGSQGQRLRRRVGAVVFAQAPAVELNLPEGAPVSKRIMPLEELTAIADSPEHFKKIAGSRAPRIAIMTGIDRQAGPGVLRAACLLGSRLIKELGASVTLFTTNAKVAAPDLEQLSQKARADGVLFVKFTEHRPALTDQGQAVVMDYREEVVDMDMRQEFDLAAVDTRPAPDAEYAGLAGLLGLRLNARGLPVAEQISSLPTGSPRAGVFVLGDARGSGDLSLQLDEAGHTLWAIGSLLRRGEVSAAPGQVAVDRKKCALCLTCVRVCPQGAMGRTARRPVANPLACTACGTCASECPMDAIELLNLEDRRFRNEIEAASSRHVAELGQEAPLELLVLACANSAAPALKAARRAGRPEPEGVRLVEVPCAGKIDPDFVLHAFSQGFDGVMAFSCYPGACRSLEGNKWAALRMQHLQRLLEESGLEPNRLFTASAAPVMQIEAMDMVAQAAREVGRLGPSPIKLGARVKEFLSRFTVSVDDSFTIVS